MTKLLVAIIAIPLFITFLAYFTWAVIQALPQNVNIAIVYPNSWVIEITRESWNLIRSLLILLLIALDLIIICPAIYVLCKLLFFDYK